MLCTIEVPCRKATEALKAAHVCQMIANDRGEVHGGEGFYDVFYIRDGAYQVMHRSSKYQNCGEHGYRSSTYKQLRNSQQAKPSHR